MNLKNKIIPSLLLVTTLLNAQSIHIDSVGANIGLAWMPTDQIDKSGSLTLDRSPEGQYYNGELYSIIGGVFDNTNYKPTINAIYNTNDDFNNYMLLVGVNRYYEYDNYDLYLGLLAGGGVQEWSYNPLHKTQEEDVSSDSLVIALQAGAEYDLTQDLHLGLNAKYYIHDYSAQLQSTDTTSTEINQAHSLSVSVGLRYSFGESTTKSAPVEVIQVEEEIKAVVVPIVVIDVDKDGILNENDICPNTPLDQKVDQDGCPEVIVLKFSFKSLSAKIQDKDESKLQGYADFLTKYTNYNVKIIGYTDSVGKKSVNQILSHKRAEAVVNNLIAKGVDTKQLSFEGRGEANPVADNATKEGRTQNRRIEAVMSRS